MIIKKGQILDGKITRIVEEAVFVDVGAEHDAVISRKDIDRLDINQSAAIQEGESIQVYVNHVPETGGNLLVSVSRVMEQKEQSLDRSRDSDSWNMIEEEYQVGDLIQGTVKNIKKYGAFVELPSGVDGLIHVSEMESGYSSFPWEVVNVGEQVTVRIIQIESDRKRIRLSLKRISS